MKTNAILIRQAAALLYVRIHCAEQRGNDSACFFGNLVAITMKGFAD
jgi:hypothetical protein